MPQGFEAWPVEAPQPCWKNTLPGSSHFGCGMLNYETPSSSTMYHQEIYSTTDLSKLDLKEWVPRDEWPKTKTFGRDVQGQIPSGRSQNQDERPDTNSILKSFARSSWKICVTWGYTKRRSWTYVGWRTINIELPILDTRNLTTPIQNQSTQMLRYMSAFGKDHLKC